MLATVVAITLLLGVLAVAVDYQSRSYADLRDSQALIQRLETGILELRRNEKDFLARKDPKYVDKFVENITAKSGDRNVEVKIARGTIGKDVEGKRLRYIRIKEQKDPPAAPTNSTIIGLVHDIGPSGATFDPPIDLIMNYDPVALTAGLTENDLYLAWWDKGEALSNLPAILAQNRVHRTRLPVQLRALAGF